MGRVYATASDLTDYTDGTDFAVPAEPEVSRVLARASERIERALLTAVYDTDNAGMPTDTNVIAALRDAVCAQVVWWDETGDEHGTAGQYESMSIGSVKLSRSSPNGNSGGAVRPDQIAPQAETHLQLAGLVPGAVTSWRWP